MPFAWVDSAAHARLQAPPARGGYHRAQGSSANELLGVVFDDDDDGNRQVGSGDVWRCLAVSAVSRMVMASEHTSLLISGISRDLASPQSPLSRRRRQASRERSESCTTLRGFTPFSRETQTNRTKYQPPVRDVLAAPSSVLSNRRPDIARQTHSEVYRTTKRSAEPTTLRRRALV